MAGEQIVIEYIASVEGLKAQLKTVQSELKAIQKQSDETSTGVQTGFTESENKIKSNAQRLKELKKELQDLTPGSSKFNQLAKQAGDLQNKINDATQATKAFAKESKLSTAKTLFGAMAQDIKELDFAGAASKARQLASVVNSISFAEVAGGLKNLVTTILNLGKALLLNPFVLIATSVAAATYALYQYSKSYEVNTKAVETNTKALAESAKTLDDIQKRIDTINQGLATADFGDSTKAFVKAQDDLFNGLQKIEDKSKETFDQLKKDFGLKDLTVGESGLFDTATLENGKKISEDVARDLNNRLFEIKEAGNKEQLKLEQEFQVTVDAISKANVDRQLKESEEIRKIKKKYSQGFEEEAFKEASILEETEAEKTKIIKDELEKRIDDRIDARKIENELEIEAEEERKKRLEKEKQQQLDNEAAANAAAVDLFRESANSLFEYQNQLDDIRLQKINSNAQTEKDIIQEKVESGVLTEKQGADAIKAIEKTLNDETRKIKTEQAKRDKEQALFNIALSTAQGIAAALATANVPLSVVIAALGAVQAAAVLARPIPEFAEGVIDLKGGVQGKDSIPAILMPGESIMTTRETQQHGDLFRAIRQNNLDEFLLENYLTPKLADVINGSTADNMAKSIKINGLDEYGIGRALRKNSGVNLQNADYLAKAIARELNGSNVKRTWS